MKFASPFVLPVPRQPDVICLNFPVLTQTTYISASATNATISPSGEIWGSIAAHPLFELLSYKIFKVSSSYLLVYKFPSKGINIQGEAFELDHMKDVMPVVVVLVLSRRSFSSIYEQKKEEDGLGRGYEGIETG